LLKQEIFFDIQTEILSDIQFNRFMEKSQRAMFQGREDMGVGGWIPDEAAFVEEGGCLCYHALILEGDIQACGGRPEKKDLVWILEEKLIRP
jgi:hypothetical protein